MVTYVVNLKCSFSCYWSARNRPSCGCIKLACTCQNYGAACRYHSETFTLTHSPVQTSCSCSVITLPISKKNDTTSTEPNYWIFIGCLRPCRDCSILAWGGRPIKEDESRKCLLLIAPRSHYRQTAAGRQWWRVDTCPNLHTQTQAGMYSQKHTHIHRWKSTYTVSPSSHKPPRPSSLPQKADAIYMSWREVTGSNQPGE